MEEQERNIRQEIIDCCRTLTAWNYVWGTWGNISVRWQEGMLITPSRILYEKMTPEDIVFVFLQNGAEQGTHIASSEKQVHRLLYQKRPDLHAIVHCHSAYATAAAAAGTAIPAVTEEMCQLLGGEIPVTPCFIPSSHHNELGEAAAYAIGKQNALLLRNHGVVCCGETLEEAMVSCRVAEKAAQIYLALLSANGEILPEVITEAWIADGRDYYRKRYGKENGEGIKI